MADHTTTPAHAAGKPTGNPTTMRVLRLLFELAEQSSPAHAGAIAARLGLSPRHAARHLLALDNAGLVRAECTRLTMSGLVLAARLPSVDASDRQPAGGQGRRGQVRVRRARTPSQLPSGWAHA